MTKPLVIFETKGRLGNAIFRYLACAILCIHCDYEYTVDKTNVNYNAITFTYCNDFIFNEITKVLLNNDQIYKQYKLLPYPFVFMSGFYQHDLIYKKYKKEIIEFILQNPQHYVLTDGVCAGDGNCEKFYTKDIVNTPEGFQKKYKNVLHIRLEDFVSNGNFLPKERLANLLEKNIIEGDLCIVCKKLQTEFESEYVAFIKEWMRQKGVIVHVESNDIITDFYIMKEAEVLICSKSTISWCAAFFSESIKKCYLPDYEISENSTCKYPIDNTELY